MSHLGLFKPNLVSQKFSLIFETCPWDHLSNCLASPLWKARAMWGQQISEIKITAEVYKKFLVVFEN
jgi:hypothetical protein